MCIILDRALDALLESTLKKKVALTTKPRPGKRRSDKRTRAISAAVRRKVWQRDGGRCAYVDKEHTRCSETRLLEYAHLTAWALGGNNTVDNIRLLCRAHNAHEACRDYGEEFMETKRSPSKVCESVTSYRRFMTGQAMSRPRGLYRALEPGASPGWRVWILHADRHSGPAPSNIDANEFVSDRNSLRTIFAARC